MQYLRVFFPSSRALNLANTCESFGAKSGPETIILYLSGSRASQQALKIERRPEQTS